MVIIIVINVVIITLGIVNKATAGENRYVIRID